MIERALLENFCSHHIRFFWIPVNQLTITVCAYVCVCVCLCLLPILFIHSRQVQKLCPIYLSLAFTGSSTNIVV